MSFELELLIQPLSEEQFLGEYFLPGRHFLSPGEADRFAALDRLVGPRSLRHLTRKLEAVQLFGPEGFRSRVPGAVAFDFYERGDTLYLRDLEKVVPEIQAMTQPLALRLGIPPHCLVLEAFATRHAGNAATFHYDHEHNFQLQLHGKKRWKLAANAHIQHPMLAHHDLKAPSEEAYAQQLPFPQSLPEPSVELETGPGSVLFFPAGYWHQTEVEGESFAINLVLKPARWAQALLHAMEQALLSHPEARAYSFGAFGSRAATTLRQHAQARFAQVQELAAACLASRTMEDASLSTQEQFFRWSPKTQGRELVDGSLRCPQMKLPHWPLSDEALPLVERVLPFEGWFSVSQMRAVVPEMDAMEIRRILSLLAGMGYLILRRSTL